MRASQKLVEITGDTIRIGVDQSIVIRFVPINRIFEVRTALHALDLDLRGWWTR